MLRARLPSYQPRKISFFFFFSFRAFPLARGGHSVSSFSTSFCLQHSSPSHQLPPYLLSLDLKIFSLVSLPKRKFFSVFLRPCMIFSRLSPIMSVPAIHKKTMHDHIWPFLYCRIYLVNFFHFNYYLQLYMGRC